MKKVMVGILIIIPIIILLTVAAVSSIISIAAVISVEELNLNIKSGGDRVKISELTDNILDIHDYVDVEVLPTRVKDKTVIWSITDVNTDPIFDGGESVQLVSESGEAVEKNTTGKFRVNTYCTFRLVGVADTQTESVYVEILGYDVERVSLSNITNPDTNSLKIGQSARLSAIFYPNESIVNQTVWQSDNESIATVDANGVITARGEGTATITLKASVYSSTKGENLRFVEGRYDLKVNGGVSSVYGDSVTTHLRTLRLSELGIAAESVKPDGLVNCTLDASGILSINNGVESASISTDNGKFTINLCGENDIVIENKEMYDQKNGYILAVSDLEHVLRVRWKSDMKQGAVTGAVWSSDKPQILTLTADGDSVRIKAGNSSIAEVRVSVNGASDSVELHIQPKVSRVELKISDATQKQGIARETVFASQRFTNVTAGTLEANTLALEFINPIAPTDAEDLAAFLDAFNFEVVKGAEYAEFSQERGKNNVLIFKPSQIRGGKVQITVKVSAKYPKFENVTNLTEDSFTINVVNGVSVSNYEEIMKASELQKKFINDVAFKGSERENEVYSIVLKDNVMIPEDIPRVNTECRIKLYGSLYGNNKRIYSINKKQFNNGDPILSINWSNVVMSNVTVRTNEVDEEISKVEDTKTLTGYIMEIMSDVENNVFRLDNILVEYSTIENGRTGINIQSSDVKFNGCIIRNIAFTAFYVPTRIDSIGAKTYTDLDREEVVWQGGEIPKYSNVTINNCVMSNLLAAAMSASTEHYTKDDNGNPRNESVWKTFYDAGKVTHIYQTGFLDLYNWHTMDNLEMIDTGNEEQNKVIAAVLGQVLYENEFQQFRYRYQGVDYFNMGLLFPAIYNGLTQDRMMSFFDNTNGDPRFKMIDTSMLEGAGLIAILGKLEIKLYVYDNTADLGPGDKYKDDAIVDRLHGIGI